MLKFHNLLKRNLMLYKIYLLHLRNLSLRWVYNWLAITQIDKINKIRVDI
jgi:hypothetical protein